MSQCGLDFGHDYHTYTGDNGWELVCDGLLRDTGE